jgi:hypothetical protein
LSDFKDYLPLEILSETILKFETLSQVKIDETLDRFCDMIVVKKEIFLILSAIFKKTLNKEMICAVNTYGYRTKQQGRARL